MEQPRNSYSLAIRELIRVRDWVWPHAHVVYPIHKWIPRTNTQELQRGRKQLLRVLTYCQSQARREMLKELEGA